MQLKTHLAIGLAVALYFLPYVNNEIIFILVVLISSTLPDIDSSFSSIGKRAIFKPIQETTKHRGILHTYTFAVALSMIFAFFIPVIALPVFIGYTSHLFADMFTIRGIKPFWPWKKISNGIVKSGGRIDQALFVAFALLDIILIIITLARILT